MFKIGLVGTGIIADFHKKAIDKNSEVIITAVCDIDIRKAENAAEGTNASVYTDYKEMAEKESLDCVILNLPHFLHRDVTVYFLNKGISVLVEKPMANTVAECEEMIEAANKTSAKFGIGHVQKYFDCYRMVKDIVDKNTLGKLCSITETRNIHYFTDVRPKWFLNKKLAGGGIGSHVLDGLVQNDLALVQLDAGLLCQSLRNFGIGNGTEQTAVAAALGGDGDGQFPQLLGNSQCLSLFPGNALLGSLVVHTHGVDGIGGSLDGQLLGQHKVAGVAVGNLDHLALLALALHILQQNNLHILILLWDYCS